MTLGRISTNITYGARSRRSLAASTYSSCASDSTAARTVRAMIGAKPSPITRITVVVEPPTDASTSSAVTIVGSARKASVILIKTSSTRPRK